MFSNPPSSSSIREDLPADVYNNPSFIFLQLYHSSGLGVHTDVPPILLPGSETIERAIKVLDHIPPYNTHKIGVVYVGDKQVGVSLKDMMYRDYSFTCFVSLKIVY